MSSYSGCSNSEVIFSTNATGNVSWVFGYGATPYSSNKVTDTVSYDSGFIGPRSATLVVDGVPYPLANYISVNEDFNPPEIISNKVFICAGDQIQLSASQSANTYQWDILGKYF